MIYTYTTQINNYQLYIQELVTLSTTLKTSREAMRLHLLSLLSHDYSDAVFIGNKSNEFANNVNLYIAEIERRIDRVHEDNLSQIASTITYFKNEIGYLTNLKEALLTEAGRYT